MAKGRTTDRTHRPRSEWGLQSHLAVTVRSGGSQAAGARPRTPTARASERVCAAGTWKP